jgi:hypothetical protein
VLVAESALEGANLEVPATMISKKRRLRELLAALEALERPRLVVARHVFDQHAGVLEGAVAAIAHELPVLIGHELVLNERLLLLQQAVGRPLRGAWQQRLRLDLGHRRVGLATVKDQQLPIVEDDVALQALVLAVTNCIQML